MRRFALSAVVSGFIPRLTAVTALEKSRRRREFRKSRKCASDVRLGQVLTMLLMLASRRVGGSA